jgi:hypothetical protein
MKNYFRVSALLLCGALASSTPAADDAAGRPNELSAAEKAAGWKLLFDGKTLTGWRPFKKSEPPKKGWEVEADGSLHCLAKGNGGDIITDAVYNNFDLQWEWKVPAKGNSGLKYLVSEERSQALGHEYQLIDDAGHADALRGAKWQTASFYDVLPPAESKKLKPVGEWNQSRVLIRGNHVEHWLNGAKVLEYELGSEEVLAGVASSKFKNVTNPKFGTKFPGHILLQYHGDEVWFRNIKIKQLD